MSIRRTVKKNVKCPNEIIIEKKKMKVEKKVKKVDEKKLKKQRGCLPDNFEHLLNTTTYLFREI